MFALETSNIYLISSWASIFLFYFYFSEGFDFFFLMWPCCFWNLCPCLYRPCSFFFFLFYNIFNKAGTVYLQITYTVTVPEIAFTGDTMSDFIVDQNNIDALRSRVLVMEVHLLCLCCVTLHILWHFGISSFIFIRPFLTSCTSCSFTLKGNFDQTYQKKRIRKEWSNSGHKLAVCFWTLE